MKDHATESFVDEGEQSGTAHPAGRPDFDMRFDCLNVVIETVHLGRSTQQQFIAQDIALNI